VLLQEILQAGRDVATVGTLLVQLARDLVRYIARPALGRVEGDGANG